MSAQDNHRLYLQTNGITPDCGSSDDEFDFSLVGVFHGERSTVFSTLVHHTSLEDCHVRESPSIDSRKLTTCNSCSGAWLFGITKFQLTLDFTFLLELWLLQPDLLSVACSLHHDSVNSEH